MEDLAPQLGGILVSDTSSDEPNPQSTLYSAGISVPVTLVVSGGLPDQADMEAHGNAMLSTLALQSDDGCGPATQFFLEQLADGQTRLKTADGHMLEVDIDPGTVGLVQGNSGVPVLLQVSPDGTLLQRDDVQIALAASGAVAENSTDSTEEQREEAGSSTPCEDSEEPMFQDGEPLPLQMYLQVGKETADENSTSMEDVVQTNTGTAVAIVTPDGDESDADELPAPTVVRRVERVERLEDFMDVVTTYHCKFCSFSCAWRSGLMSHFRSCHVAPSSSGSLEPVERPVSSRSTVKPASKSARAGNNAVAFALTTAVDSGAMEPAVTAQVEPPQPLTSTPANMQVSETTSELATDPVPSRTPMDASLVLESALASMVSAGSNEILTSGSSLLPRDDFVIADADANTDTTEVLDDEEIVQLVSVAQEESEDANDPDTVKASVPTPSQVMDAVDLLRRFAGAHEGAEDALISLASYENCVLTKCADENPKITSFFTRQ
ncbi:hypothetical protein HPB52_023532 [Rhipicephalus sanguineus]|uniref:C2H2-type domain-containing protein n=1 Tax=Rhipicephalus sanguineus TaxID=34632 RepID=A0A9D4YR02_RHISA|nr:hypothetical protein HPB52_023532 [Rhipicephalus sanguineus]